MRLITIEEYNPKLMQLARPVFDKYRRVLLAAGRQIHPIYLDRLKAMDIRYLFVEDAVSYGITMEEMVDVPTWMDAIEIIEAAFKSVATKGELPLRELHRLVVHLVDEVGKRKALFLVPSSSLAEELRMYAHAVNVALISLMLAKKMNIHQLQLKDLAFGALLHDIGKLLTDVEEDHPRVGFEFLRRIREINLLSAHVSFQHHEAVDGSGTPRGLIGEQIHLFAQICAIANIYENSISKEGLPPHVAMEYIMTKSGSIFAPDLVQHFIQGIPLYIPGTGVILNNNRKAIVTRIVDNLQRPYIRYLDTEEEISLANHLTLLISKVMDRETDMTSDE
ncbi:HD-GYP domain-containing protein [Cytobacillus sp. Hz8]|uniref:HD-GYP domain-containing protein n=1 Tax=Cytobacillus sp. Hz8 TaxID=3347168 RepID=UPI0035D6978B